MSIPPVPAVVGTADDLLGLARRVIDAQSEMFVADPAAGVTCRAGCSACCSQPVSVTPAELRGIAAAVADLPEPRRRSIAERARRAAAQLATGGVTASAFAAVFVDPAARRRFGLDYFALDVPCALLRDGVCEVRAVRPLVCREYLVASDPAHCATLATGDEAVVRVRGRTDVVAGFRSVSAEMGEPDRSLLALALPAALDGARPAPPEVVPRSGPSLVALLGATRRGMPLASTAADSHGVSSSRDRWPCSDGRLPRLAEADPPPDVDRNDPIDLPALLAPFTVADLLDLHHRRQPLLRRGGLARHRSLFGVDAVAVAVAASPGDPGDGTVMACGTRPAATGNEHYRLPYVPGRGRSVADLNRALAAGYTIHAVGLQRRHETLARLCASAEAHLQHRLGATFFLSPPGGSGFAAHIDPTDVVTLQIEGTKRWLLWDSGEIPTDPPAHPFEMPNRAPDLVIDLEPGDLLLVPRGWLHVAVAGDEMALHLALVVRAMRWSDLLGEAATRRAACDPRLRATVPLRGLAVALADQATELWLAAQALRTADDPEVAREHADTWLAEALARRLEDHSAPFSSQLTAPWAMSLSPDTEVVQVDGLRPVVVERSGWVRLVFPGGYVEGPPAARPALDHLASSARLRPRDLPGLPPDDQLELARQVVVQGLCRPVRGR